MSDAISVGPTLDSLSDTPGVVVESNYEGGMVDLQRAPAEPEADPELIGGKFKTQDDLLKAYKELESGIGKPKEDAPAAEEKPADPLKMGEPEPEAEGDPVEGEEEPAAEEAPALNVQELSTQYLETGELTEDNYTALAAVGISKEYVDAFAEGIQATQTLRTQELHKAAGGEEEFNALLKWGGANLSEEQQSAFNTATEVAVGEGDFTAATMLIQGVKSQMVGNEPNLLNTTTDVSDPAVQPFGSQSEVSAAMRDPAYRSDPAYVASVQARLAVTNL
jgi:hypothetical protein